jgi:hypothetical protein
MNPNQPDIMPGVRDYQVYLPFTRRAGEGDETVTMTVRLPAANPVAAVQLGATIAVSVGNANAAVVTDRAEEWRPVVDGITVKDVDDVPDLPEVLAELDHWRRVVTVLATTFPGMAQVSVEDYQAADFSRLTLVPINERTMMFADAGQLASASHVPVSNLEPVAADVQLPEPYGAYQDPDVKQVKVHNVTLFPPKSYEVLHDGQWLPVVGTNITGELAVELTVLPADREYATVTFRDLNADIVVRPVTVEAQASDLPAASVHGRQVLTIDGWWAVAAAEFLGPIANCYKTVMARPAHRRSALGAVVVTDDDVTRVTSYTTGEKVLLRDVPGSWWS